MAPSIVDTAVPEGLEVSRLYPGLLPWGVRLREADRQECLGLGFTPEQALVESISASDFSYCISVNDKPLAYWGWSQTSLLASSAAAWMLSTPEVEKHPRLFAKSSRWHLQRLLSQFNSITVLADTEYPLAMRWLDWLGFKPYITYGRYVGMRIGRKS